MAPIGRTSSMDMDGIATYDVTTSLVRTKHASYSSSDETATLQHYSDTASSSDASSDASSAASDDGSLEPPASSTSADRTGLLCVTASAFLFGVVAALVKALALDVYVVLQCRSLLQWLFSLIALRLRGPLTIDALCGTPRRRWILLLRSALYWGFIMLFWAALARMPVGDATALVYCAPLCTALFGWLLLGEQVSMAVVASLGMSLVGVALITRPTFLFGEGTPTDGDARYQRGMLYAFGSAVAGGVLPVLVRKSKDCHWATVEHLASLCSGALFTPATLTVMTLHGHPDSWEGLRDPTKLILVALVAVIGFASLGLQTYGYQRASAARASAMGFLEIPFAYGLQYAVFGDLLTWGQGGGMGLVVAAGLLNVGAEAPADDRKTRSGEHCEVVSVDCEAVQGADTCHYKPVADNVHM